MITELPLVALNTISTFVLAFVCCVSSAFPEASRVVFWSAEHTGSHTALQRGMSFSHVATLISDYGMHESFRKYSAEVLCFEDG